MLCKYLERSRIQLIQLTQGRLQLFQVMHSHAFTLMETRLHSNAFLAIQ